jgi:hypothetical protein
MSVDTISFRLQGKFTSEVPLEQLQLQEIPKSIDIEN